MARRTVYIVDDEEPVRGALQTMLGVHGYGVTAFASGHALLEIVDSLAPGCLLLDVRMPEMDGIEVQRRLRKRGIDLPVVVMTGHGDLAVGIAALQEGAVAFIEKPFAKETVHQALNTAFLRLEDPGRYALHLARTAAAVAALEPNERAVLIQLAAGHPNEMIAAELGVSPAIVEVRRARLLADLGAKTVNDLLTIAIAAGLGPGDYATLPKDP